MEERATKERTAEKKLLQWHPAFYASIQIELSEEADKLIFEREHNLGTKPMLIDVLVIKKNSEDRILKNIGRIFRKFNIVEYKSPEDYLSIDDFYKVYGYCCFYKSQAEKQNGIKVDELTITFICSHYPRKFLKHLKSKRQIRVEKCDHGIYYLIGDSIPMQLIVTPKLSKEENLWLKHLTNKLKSNEVEHLIKEFKKHENERLHKSVMDLIIHANNEVFREAKNMCDALMELMKEELEESKSIGLQQGIELGIEQIIRNALRKGHTPEQISDFSGIPLEEVLAVQLIMTEEDKNEMIHNAT